MDDFEARYGDSLAALTDRLLRIDTSGGNEAPVQAVFRDWLAADGWLAEHPPELDRFGVQFSAAEIDPEDPLVDAVQSALTDHGGSETAPTGETDGSDARHHLRAGIPTVVFGPDRIEQPHFPDESVPWDGILESGALLRDAAIAYLETCSRGNHR